MQWLAFRCFSDGGSVCVCVCVCVYEGECVCVCVFKNEKEWELVPKLKKKKDCEEEYIATERRN